MTHTGDSLETRIAAAIRASPGRQRAEGYRRLRELGASTGWRRPDLEALLRDPSADPALRAFLVWGAAAADEQSLVDLMVDVWRDEPPIPVAGEIAKALGPRGLGGEALADTLTSSTSLAHRQAAAHALGHAEQRDPRVHPALAQVLADAGEDPELRGYAAEALGTRRHAEALPALLRASRDDLAHLRYWAAFALGDLGDGRALPRLRELVGDRSPVDPWGTVSEAAHRSIETLEAGEEDPA
ncbi:MAG: HEAT repeat domain-containing protein [Acidobacteriota bacterium]